MVSESVPVVLVVSVPVVVSSPLVVPVVVSPVVLVEVSPPLVVPEELVLVEVDVPEVPVVVSSPDVDSSFEPPSLLSTTSSSSSSRSLLPSDSESVGVCPPDGVQAKDAMHSARRAPVLELARGRRRRGRTPGGMGFDR